MANVYAIKTGTWSDPTTWNTGTIPAAADNVYANGFIVTLDGSFTVSSIRNYSDTGIANGGYFSPTNSSVLTCTADRGVVGNLANFGCYHSTLGLNESSVLNATNISTLVNSATSNIFGAFNSGPGNLTINGSVRGGESSNISAQSIHQYGVGNGTAATLTPGKLVVNGNCFGGYPTAYYGNRPGVLNYGDLDVFGNLYGGGNTSYSSDSTGVTSNGSSSRINIVGNCYGGAGVGAHGLLVTGTSFKLNITGNCYGGMSSAATSGAYVGSVSTQNITNITGDVVGAYSTQLNTDGNGVTFACAGFLNLTGTCFGGRAATQGYSSSGLAVYSYAPTVVVVGNSYAGPMGSGIRNAGSANSFVDHTGLIDSSQQPFTAYTSSFLTKNYITGPILSNPVNGAQGMSAPHWNVKQGYKDSVYMTFYDNASPAPNICRFFTEGALIGYPSATDVRKDISYGPSSQYTGNCAVPVPAVVLKDVPVDATAGTLDIASAVWNTPTTTTFQEGSLGQRLKNTATVATTAAQLAAFGS